MLGPIHPPGTTIGPLREEIGQSVGASDTLLVIAPACHDTASAVAATPADASSAWCYLSSGTWSLLGAELPGPQITEAARSARFTNEAGVAGTTRFLKNITGLWLVQECARDLARSGPSVSYDRLTDLAQEAEPFRTLIDPGHAPFGQPGEMVEKIRDFARATGQPEPYDPGRVVRCCLESLALAYRATLAQLERVLEQRFEVIHVLGGGGRNRLLNRMTADATGRQVVVGPYEATAAGNVLVQAMGQGDAGDLADLRRRVRRAFEPEIFEPVDTEGWEDAAGRFLELQQRPVG
jgi:rhamnulokinase